jgi:hypothetical protein
MVTMRAERALVYAIQAHSGRVDQADLPQILHPIRVMLNCLPDQSAMVVGVFHDAIEDTEYELRKGMNAAVYHPKTDPAGFALTVYEAEALDLVTRAPSGTSNRPTHQQYVMRICEAPGEAGRIARKVKLEDVEDNMTRPSPDELKKAMRCRYERAYEQIVTAMIEKGEITPDEWAERAAQVVVVDE